MTETQLSDDEITSRRERRRNWYGYLADENVEHIASRIDKMLIGRRYTFVANNVEQKHSVPEVRTGQMLTPEKTDSKRSPRFYRIGDTDTWDNQPSTFCGITCADTYGVWGINSSHATEAEARDDERYATYVNIEGGLGEGARNERIEIKQHNGYGEMLHWVIAVEVSA